MYNPTVTSQNAYTVSINYPRGDEEGGGGKTSHMNRYLNLWISGWMTECIDEWIDRLMDECMDGWMTGCMYGGTVDG